MNMIVGCAYMVACIFFIIGIKKITKVQTAIQGNFLAAVGLLIGVVAVFFESDVMASWDADLMKNGYLWCAVAIAIGSVIGYVWSKKVKMTGMPELVALYNGFGGLASALVAFSEFWNERDGVDVISAVAIGITIFIGAVAFTGSLLAWGKLSEKLPGRAILFKGQKMINLVLFLSVIAMIIIYALPNVDAGLKFNAILILSAVSLIFGITLVLPIGGGDMPVVISLINSFTGLAVAAAGFIITNSG